MGTKRVLIGRVVIVKTYRKHGNGAKGGGRRNESGKRGYIYDLDASGTPIEPEIAVAEGSTMHELGGNLRKTGFIPPHVALHKSGKTYF